MFKSKRLIDTKAETIKSIETFIFVLFIENSIYLFKSIRKTSDVALFFNPTALNAHEVANNEEKQDEQGQNSGSAKENGKHIILASESARL